MEIVWEYLNRLLDSFQNSYIITVVDILLVTYILYRGYLLIAGTRAIQILLGLLLILVMAILAQFFQLTTLNWLLKNISTYIFIAFIIIFQPELRRILSQMGQNRLLSGLFQDEDSGLAVDEIINGVRYMAHAKVGSLIVIVKNTGLKNYIETGTRIDATVSEELLRNIFYEKAPLHDGAVIINNNKILAAACYLPLSDSQQLKKEHGARHRAALGIAEESDALILVTSEETGFISIATEGKLYYNVNEKELKNMVLQLLKGKASN